jgi:hypothetical protein
VALMSSTEAFKKRISASSLLLSTRSRETQPKPPQQQDTSPLASYAHQLEPSASGSSKATIPSVIAGLDLSVLDAPSSATKKRVGASVFSALK